MALRASLIDFRPLRVHRNYRLLFMGQTISTFGSMLTLIAIPYQVWQLTRSTFWVGAVSVVRLLGLLTFGLWGGVIADRSNRRRLVILSEIGLAIVSVALTVNAMLGTPSVELIFILTLMMASVDGFHRPALESLTPQLVPRSDLLAVSSLGNIRWSLAAVTGPALGGVLIATVGARATYAIDVLTFVVSIFCVSRMRLSDAERAAVERAEQPASASGAPQGRMAALKEGLVYAKNHEELLGTYIVDIVANLFAMPIALFPALAERWASQADAPRIVGWLYAAIPLGVLTMSLFSGWTSRISRQGRIIVLSATLWGLSITALAFTDSLQAALLLLFLAGAADAVSGMFRGTMWNQIIPTGLRGRLASVEMLSYMTGPLLGNARSGMMAKGFGIPFAIWSGGILCVLSVGLCVWVFPKFWNYQAPKA